MTPQQILLVRTSFAAVEQQPDAFAAAFYARLFAIAPETRRLFAGTDMPGQGAKLMAMLRTAVAALSAPEVLLPALDALGRRHAGYGVRASHYGAVGQALVETLRLALKADFTPGVAAAWCAVYGAVADRMQAAAGDLAKVA